MTSLKLLLLVAGSVALSALRRRFFGSYRAKEVIEEAVEEAVQSGAYRVARPSTLN